jgi:hypothetical protein
METVHPPPFTPSPAPQPSRRPRSWVSLPLGPAPCKASTRHQAPDSATAPSQTLGQAPRPGSHTPEDLKLKRGRGGVPPSKPSATFAKGLPSPSRDVVIRRSAGQARSEAPSDESGVRWRVSLARAIRSAGARMPATSPPAALPLNPIPSRPPLEGADEVEAQSLKPTPPFSWGQVVLRARRERGGVLGCTPHKRVAARSARWPQINGG